MNTVIINGKTYSGGRSISVINNRVFIDGKEVTDDSISEQKEINITVNGNVDSLKVDACNQVQVTGDCQRVETASGSVRVGGSVGGKVESSSGSIQISGPVTGDVESMSGSVHCGNVAGRVKTMSGSIRHS
jgi:cytoskeletal protein CcmA (bactofilin family)